MAKTCLSPPSLNVTLIFFSFFLPLLSTFKLCKFSISEIFLQQLFLL